MTNFAKVLFLGPVQKSVRSTSAPHRDDHKSRLLNRSALFDRTVEAYGRGALSIAAGTPFQELDREEAAPHRGILHFAQLWTDYPLASATARRPQGRVQASPHCSFHSSRALGCSPPNRLHGSATRRLLA